jgi:redox-sensitive bicupin YhaK (pirin superfamily)
MIMKTKNIEIVLPPRPPHYVGDGFRVHNFIPSGFRADMQRMDPFIMLDYNSKFAFPPSEKPKGVGVHPHRGFETVTIAYQGKVAHHDSAGGGGVIGQGDVQWMTAASGVLHKEYHEEEFSKKGGDFQMVQLWVNLPAKDKMSKPQYQGITNAEMGKHILPDNAGTIEVIAGNYLETKGAASTFSPVHMMNAKLNTGGKASFNFPANYTTALLVVEGSVKVNDQEVALDHFVIFEKDGEDFVVEATENCIALIISGEPLNEPIAAHGPFVMNTQEQIQEAFQDYNLGKFGFLED